MLRHWVTWRSRSEIHSHVMENVTLTRISSKLPVARSLPRPSRDCGRRSPKTSDVTECQTTSYHDPTCGEVCLRFCVRVLRLSHLQCVPFCRTVFLHCVGRRTSQLLARSEVVSGRASPFFSVPVNATYDFAFFFEVLTSKSTLLSPSNDTRCCAPHFPVRRRTANIRVNCRPCMYAHVLEERAVLKLSQCTRNESSCFSYSAR